MLVTFQQILLLEMEGVWDQCKVHNKKKELICLADNTLVCYDCVVFGDHKGHQMKKLSDFQDAVKSKKSELQSIENKLTKGFRGLRNSLIEWRKKVCFDVQQRFQRLHMILSMKENESFQG